MNLSAGMPAAEPIPGAGARTTQDHWAYRTPQRPALPSVRNRSWPKNELDRFILSRLETEHLKPSPEAARHTLIRRATLDLTGLPPTVAEVDAFLADSRPGAYEKLLDRLLATAAYGERMGQQWLDLARYADSDGYHADNSRSMWQYRDYVIRSFNANKPFDQFTVEQLAGDLLPNPTPEQRIATAFNRNGMSSTEGGADPEEYLNKYVTDRVNTFGTVYLGSSITCCECHDHKYDPFTQREYYQLYDFFNRIPEKGLDSDPAPPFIQVPTADQTTERQRLKEEIATWEGRQRAALERSDEGLDREQVRWEQERRAALQTHWETLEPMHVGAAQGAVSKILEDQSVLAGGTASERETYEITLKPSHHELTALRLETLPDPSLPHQGAGRGADGGFILTGIEVQAESANPAGEPPVGETGWGKWSLLGAFKAGSANEVFEKPFISEGQFDPAKTYEEGRLKWTEAAAWKDGVAQPLWGENLVTYFHRIVTVRTARQIALKLGSDGGMQVRLNGSRVDGGQVRRGKATEPESLLVRLSAGENHLLLKVHHGSGAGGFYFGWSDEPVTHHAVALAAAFANSQRKDFPIAAAIDDKPDTGWSVDAPASPGRAVFVFKTPVSFAAGTVLKVRLKCESPANQQLLGRFRLAASDHPGGWGTITTLPADIHAALFTDPDALTPAERTALRNHYRGEFDPGLKLANEKLAAVRKASTDLNGRIATLRVMEDQTEPRTTQIRIRGDYRNHGETVRAGVPRILPPLPADAKPDRLALARWLVDPRHPLLARVTVNRYWAMFFGTGLVKTGNEFGAQGEAPSHPELLDWLARDFIDGGWDIKALQKKILLSATYRQSSKPTPELLVRDPNNRWLGHGPRFRMPAEMVRDCALDYAGLLDRKRAPGGPSVKPYQPAGLWEEKMFGGNKYEESQGADLYRRSFYTLWKRTVLNPTLMTFDAPDRALCTEQRGITCTPLQAFVTLNEKGFVEAARVFAERILREGGPDTGRRLDFAYRTVLARPPTPPERKILIGIHADMVASYQRNLKGALDLIGTGEWKRAENVNEIELAAWTGVANVLFNLDETITKE